MEEYKQTIVEGMVRRKNWNNLNSWSLSDIKAVKFNFKCI
jgi:hypothetical protein